MPYISQLDRSLLDKEIAALSERLKALMGGMSQERFNIGLMNYAITSLILRTCPLSGYTDMNNVVGLLECVKLEFVRRRLNPYEDLKAKERGDVY